MNQPALVRRLQAPANLANHVDRPLDRQTLARRADQPVQRNARQQRHHQVGLDAVTILELPDIINLHDIRVDQRREVLAFFLKQLQCIGVSDIQDGFQGHGPLHHRVVGLVNNAHSPLGEDLFDLVSALNVRGRLHGSLLWLRLYQHMAIIGHE